MAEDSGLEKKHEPTGKRITELRRRGQALRSKDLSSGSVFIFSIILLSFFANKFAHALAANFIYCFDAIGDVVRYKDFPGPILKILGINTLLLLLPFFAGILATTLLSPFLFGGWNFTLEPLQPNFGKLNPLNNLKKMFSSRLVMGVVGAMLKVSLIMSALGYFTYSRIPELMHLSQLPLNQAAIHLYGLTSDFVSVLAGVIVFVIGYDVFYTWYEYFKRNRMSDQEVKDEGKESEGNPEVKRKMRGRQLSLLRQRMSLIVPKATVIITNPTHYAVAIRYEERKDRAPRVIAKGKDHLAQQIREIAIANGVPIYPAPLLARAIYHTSNLGVEINPGLYMAIAIVLTYVNQLKNYQQGKTQGLPIMTQDLKIPQELVYNE